MKLLPDIPLEKYNDVEFVLNYLHNNPVIGNEDVEPIQYFHCFWKGTLSDLHLMCLESLKETHPNCTVLFWTPNLLEVQGSYSWIKIKRLFKDRITLQEVKYEHFKEAKIPSLFSQYSLLTQIQITESYKHNLAYASDIIRFIVLNIYGGIWFDMDILFLKNFDSIRMKRYVSQWGDGIIGIADNDYCGNAAILRLERGHDLIQILKNYPRPFYPLTCFQLKNNINLTILPSTFFDIHWQPINQLQNLSFKTCDEFFKQEELNLPKEIYAYHWHNRWANPLPPFFLNKKRDSN